MEVNAVGLLLGLARKRGAWGGVSPKTKYDAVNIAPDEPAASEGLAFVEDSELRTTPGHVLT